jgi:phospholipid/cholesterol/gamma-HCH transport system ATP-binding protein
MDRRRTILELSEAVPGSVSVPLSLLLRPGEFALIRCAEPDRAAGFADICCGLSPVQTGWVSFLGRDWTRLSQARAAALRGRIGRVFYEDAWIDFLDAEANILLSQLHHTRRETTELRARGAALAHDFGLPGLPTGRPSALSAADLARAACIRAFLGEPMMVVLENPIGARCPDLAAPLLNAILGACDRGAAALWLTSGDAVWGDPSTPATARFHLSGRGLTRIRDAA